MSQIRVSNLTFGYEASADDVFEDSSFSFDTEWKLGFIGRNGKGKTTFLRLLMGEYEYAGTIQSSVYFDLFPYAVSAEQRQQCMADFIEELKPATEQWRVIMELEQLEESAELLYRPFETLSPGEQTKLLLAILFSGENEFLLIDEPTNHLDIHARECVKRYLMGKKGFVLVSHDRDLLDACVDHVLVLNRQTIEVQSGNFSSWWENKERADRYAISSNEKHQKEIRKLERAADRTARWADKSEGTKIGFDPVKEHDRNISTRAYIGAKTKKMQSRVKQMEKRIDEEIRQKEGLLVDLEKNVDLRLVNLTHHKQRLLEVRDYGVCYLNAKKPVFENLSFELMQKDRIALQGANGCGKSTLIKRVLELAGVKTETLLIQEEGRIELASGLIISYVGQDTSGLKGSLFLHCEKHALEESLFLSILRQLDFDRQQFGKPIESFSEGQKKKVLLATSLLTPAHLYIWDEPLNFIDVFSRMQLEKLITAYEPTLLFVEHDVRFRQKIATKEIVFLS